MQFNPSVGYGIFLLGRPLQLTKTVNITKEVRATVGIVILAAGASTRMGTSKQLLLYQGRSLLCRIVETALASVCQPTIVVLGASAEQLQQEIKHLPVQVVENLQWAEGMSSSIFTGINVLNAESVKVSAVVLLLCDQPLVCVQVINQLVETHYSTGKPIIASEYSATLGVPALFSHTFFPELMTLKGGEGAKQLLKNHSEDVYSLPFPDGVIDIDTPEDYEQLSRGGRGGSGGSGAGGQRRQGEVITNFSSKEFQIVKAFLP